MATGVRPRGDVAGCQPAGCGDTEQCLDGPRTSLRVSNAHVSRYVSNCRQAWGGGRRKAPFPIVVEIQVLLTGHEETECGPIPSPALRRGPRGQSLPQHRLSAGNPPYEPEKVETGVFFRLQDVRPLSRKHSPLESQRLPGARGCWSGRERAGPASPKWTPIQVVAPETLQTSFFCHRWCSSHRGLGGHMLLQTHVFEPLKKQSACV